MIPEDGEPAGLYLHVPFCSAICPYCDFAVLVAGRDRRQRFVEALLLEIDLHAATLAAPIDTIYFGGGTPSLLTAEDLEQLLEAIRQTFRPRPETRIYLEANPEDVHPESLSTWLRLGIGTLSLGVQSFDDDELRFLGRRHDAAAARQSLELAMAAGFETVSVDLIYGLPEQDAATWRRSLDQAVASRPDHLSCYELEIHPRTTFGKRHARGELVAMPDDPQAELFLLTHRLLADHGYAGYEVSNFARNPRQHSRHNGKYWRHVPYLGLGPAAHSFDGRRRWWNERALARWQQQVTSGRQPVADSETLDDRDLALETVMLGLRTADGVDLHGFQDRFGFDLAERNRALVERLQRDGLLSCINSRLTPTLEGLAVADGLASAFSLGRGN